MRYDEVPPSGRVYRANDGYTFPTHRAKHWQGNRPTDCDWCQMEAQFTPQAPVFIPAPVSAREDGGARALVLFFLLLGVLATGAPGVWSLYLAITNLGDVYAWHVAWLPLLTTAVLFGYGIHRIGQNR